MPCMGKFTLSSGVRVSSSPSIVAAMHWCKCTYTAHSLDIFICYREGIIDSLVWTSSFSVASKNL